MSSFEKNGEELNYKVIFEENYKRFRKEDILKDK